MSAHAIGYIAAIIQAVLYATMGIFAKLLYECGLSAQLVMVLRFSCTVLFLGLFILFFHGRKFISHQPAVYVQSIFFFLSAWLYFLAVERINAGLATVLFYTFPALVAVMNVIAFHEKIIARVIIALALSLCGIILISGLLAPGQAAIDPLGVIFAIAACTSFAIYSVLIQKTSRTESSFTATFTISLVCLVASLILFAGELGGLAHVGIKEFALGSGLAILATILPIVLYIFAIARIGATKASILSIIETPSSLLLAWLILGETIDVFQGIGALLVVIATLSVTVKPRENEKREDAN